MDQKKAGVLLSYAQTALSTVLSLLYTPVMLRLLGRSEYGTYTLVNGFISNLTLLSFGLGSAYVRFFARADASEGEDGVARVNGMFMSVFLVIGALSLAVGGVLVANVHRIFAAKLTAQELSTARLLMALLVVNIAVSFPCSVFTSYVTAKERFFFQRMLTIVRTVLNPIMMLPMLLMGLGSVALVLVTILLTVITDGFNIWYCLKKLRMRVDFRGFDFGVLREMAGFSFFIFLNTVVNQINWSVDTTLLGILRGTADTAVYGVGMQIYNYYMALSTAISGVYVPQINRLVARGQEEELTHLFTRVGRVQFMLLALVLTGFWLVGRPFIYAWGAGEYDGAYAIALLLMATTTVPLIQNMGIEIQRAKNMHQFRSKVYLGMALINVLVSIPLGKRYGGFGCALGTAFSMIVGNGLIMNVYYHRRIGLDMRYFWRQILRLVPAMLPPVLAGAVAARFIRVSGYGGVLAFAVPYALAFFACVYRFAMNEDEKKLVRGMTGRLRARG